LESLDHIQINFSENNVVFLNICLGILMLGVAIELKFSDFKYILKNPKAVMAGWVSQWILLPVLTMGLIWWIKPIYSLSMGMILIAACPGGNISNYTVHLAQANVALSIVLTIISTVFCVVSTPFIFSVLHQYLPVSSENIKTFDIRLIDMFKTIFQLILVPLIVGIFLNHKFPSFVNKIKKILKNLSLLIFVGFVVVALMSNYDNLKAYLHIVFGIVLLHNFIALVTGYVWSRHIVRLPLSDSRAISIETGIQNSGLALILIFNFFDANGGMALIAAWWSIWHLISSFGLSYWWSKRALANS